jgi:ATP-dependent helicase HepA
VNDLAAKRLKVIAAEAAEVMDGQLQNEIERLEDLNEINDHVRPEEIAALKAQKKELHEVIGAARVRLDAVRMIWKVRG